MSEIMNIIKEFKKPCPCGREHATSIWDVQIGSGLVHRVGEILKNNNFPRTILLVADKNTLSAAAGIEESLSGFEIEYDIYNNLRVATIEEVERTEKLIAGRDIGVLSVGTGSINDVCRLASARQDKKLCIFATAPSMDGFASYSSPIVNCGFKLSYPAKSPEVIIGDTKILACAPASLKSAGFGDMAAKYIGLVDWQISALLTNEYYCDRIASLTRTAVDELMEMAEKVTLNDEKTAGEIFSSLLKTGIGMSFSQNSRPASGSEHIVAHLIECVELRDNIIPNLHGEDIGVCTLEVMKIYQKLKELKSIRAKEEDTDWDEVFGFYGNMAKEVEKLNFPETITDCVDKKLLEEKWGEITGIINSIPSFDICKDAMERAGCKITVDDIGKDKELFCACVKFSPYMRKRLTLLRLMSIIDTDL